MEERSADSADEQDRTERDNPQPYDSTAALSPAPSLGETRAPDAAHSTLTAEGTGSVPPSSLAEVPTPPGTSGVVWGEVVEYDYDIPEVEATEVEIELDDDTEHGDKSNDESGDTPTEGNPEEMKKKVSKWWTYVSVASAFIGISAASQLMNPDLIDEDDVIGIAAIVNSGAVTAHAAATASVPAGGATATAAAGAGGGVTAGSTFASAAGVGSTGAAK